MDGQSLTFLLRTKLNLTENNMYFSSISLKIDYIVSPWKISKGSLGQQRETKS